jgi:hypothetical protein
MSASMAPSRKRLAKTWQEFSLLWPFLVPTNTDLGWCV